MQWRQLGGKSIRAGVGRRILLTSPWPGCRWAPPCSCSCTWWRAPSRPSSQAPRTKIRDLKATKTPPVALPASEAGLMGGLVVKGDGGGAFTSSFWRMPTLIRPHKNQENHFWGVDSSQLNPSRAYVLGRGDGNSTGHRGGIRGGGGGGGGVGRQSNVDPGRVTAGTRDRHHWHREPGTTTGASFLIEERGGMSICFLFNKSCKRLNEFSSGILRKTGAKYAINIATSG